MGQVPDEGLLQFPCDYVFKAFGPAAPDAGFEAAVLNAVSEVVPIGKDALRTRGSRGGNYLCVSVVVRVLSRQQLDSIYLELRRIPGLNYLL